MFGTMAVSIGIQFLFPYPYGLIISLAIFIALPMITRKLMIKNNWQGRFGGMQEVKMNKVCTVCGSKSKGRECFRCGSHQFRMR